MGGPARFDALVAAFGLELAMLVSASGDVRLTNAFRQRLNSDLELQR